MKTIKIPDQYFDCLKNSRSVVPRYQQTGEVIPFTVGKEYIIINSSNEKLKARCTQNCPYNLILIPD